MAQGKLPRGFNAARGFVGGAAKWYDENETGFPRFNAARGFVGGAAVTIKGGRSRWTLVSMPHAALWVVQHPEYCYLKWDEHVSMPHAAIPFRPHHRFAVPLPRSRRGGLVRLRFLTESRNISFPRRCGGSGERSEPIGAPMPHAALWVVQQLYASKS